MNIEIYKNRYYPEMENLFSADNCNWAYGNNEEFPEAPGESKHIFIDEKKNIKELLDSLEEKLQNIWPENNPIVNFIFSASYNNLGMRQIQPKSGRYVTYEELSDEEFCEFLKELSSHPYFKVIK